MDSKPSSSRALQVELVNAQAFKQNIQCTFKFVRYSSHRRRYGKGWGGL